MGDHFVDHFHLFRNAVCRSALFFSRDAVVFQVAFKTGVILEQIIVVDLVDHDVGTCVTGRFGAGCLGVGGCGGGLVCGTCHKAQEHTECEEQGDTLFQHVSYLFRFILPQSAADYDFFLLARTTARTRMTPVNMLLPLSLMPRSPSA